MPFVDIDTYTVFNLVIVNLIKMVAIGRGVVTTTLCAGCWRTGATRCNQPYTLETVSLMKV